MLIEGAGGLLVPMTRSVSRRRSRGSSRPRPGSWCSRTGDQPCAPHVRGHRTAGSPRGYVSLIGRARTTAPSRPTSAARGAHRRPRPERCMALPTRRLLAALRAHWRRRQSGGKTRSRTSAPRSTRKHSPVEREAAQICSKAKTAKAGAVSYATADQTWSTPEPGTSRSTNAEGPLPAAAQNADDAEPAHSRDPVKALKRKAKHAKRSVVAQRHRHHHSVDAEAGFA